MKFLNKYSVLLLIFLFTFQACEQEGLIQSEVETFKSIDLLPTDDRFVDLVVESINVSTKANPDQLDRAQELINQESRTTADQAEIAQIMGYDSWDALTVHTEKYQKLFEELNDDYNLAGYEEEELRALSSQVYEYIMETQGTPRDDLGLGLGGVLGGPSGGGGVADPCVAACNATLTLCLVGNGIVFVFWFETCRFHPDPVACHIANFIGLVGVGHNCFVSHTDCIDAC